MSATAEQAIPAAGSAELARMQRIFERQRAAFAEERYPDYGTRVARLQSLVDAVEEYQDRLAAAMNEDFGGRSFDESVMLDCLVPIKEAKAAKRSLRRWMKPERRSVGLALMGTRARLLPQPKGVVGIISAWNYPVHLALAPLVPALAAGNRAMIKMSEYSPRSSAVLKECLASVFDKNLVAVVDGGPEEGAAFSALPFDHILFTGSSRVGALVMAEAAKNLTPVTLELGGKSPVIIADDCPLDLAAERITYGKFLNGGQTCIAPDYVLLPEGKEQPFIDECKARFAAMYPDFSDNADVTNLANDNQRRRLAAWLQDAEAKGARIDRVDAPYESGATRMPLHFLSDVDDSMLVMQEEIFGPLLPIVTYRDIGEAIAYVNERPRPLALYFFGFDRDERDRVTKQTTAGGMAVNECVFHALVEDAPFGGVGNSGMGHYHGREGFNEFSKQKTILLKGKLNLGRLMYPPYDKKIKPFLHKLLKL